MSQRINYGELAPNGLRPIQALEGYVKASGFGQPLLNLVKLRASQLNGCAYCVDLHAREARAAGEAEHRLHAATVWRDAPYFSPLERAALAWTEALALVSRDGVPERLFSHAREHFSERELVDLTLAVIAINAWNRLAIRFRPPVGEPPEAPVPATATAG